MNAQTLVTNRLNDIYRSRSHQSLYPHLIIIIASTYFQRDGLLNHDFWFVSLGLILFGSIFRGLVIGPLFKLWANGEWKARWLNHFAFFLISFGWGVHFWDVYNGFGGDAANASYTLLILVCFITSSSITLIGDSKSFYIFLTVISLSPILTYLQDSSSAHRFVISYIIIFYLFSLGHFRLAHNQLYSLLLAQARSDEESDRLKNIINTVPGYVTLIDKDLKCYMANSNTLRLAPEIIGLHLESPVFLSGWNYIVLDFMKSNQPSFFTEHHTVVHGKDLSCFLSAKRMSDGGAIVVAIDTTELVSAQKKIREQEAKAVYTNKLTALGEMAAGIAHEVNNPLTIIHGAAKIIQDLVDKTPMDLESVKLLSQKMMDTSERISKIVKSLKTLSRDGEKEVIGDVFVSDIIEQCLDISGERFKRYNIELKLPNFSTDLRVKGRNVQLSQVLMNLLSNAIDASRMSSNPWVEIKLKTEDRDLCIDIIDSGTGVSLEIRNRIMEPFFSTKNVNQGTGLGLSISKRITQDHHGDLILVEDATHTTFRMIAPLS